MPLNTESFTFAADHDELEEALDRAVDCVLDNALCNDVTADGGFADADEINDVYSIDLSALSESDGQEYERRLNTWLTENRGKAVGDASTSA